MTDAMQIPPEFWSDDILERKSDAQYLTKFLTKRYQAKPQENGFVLAINAEWGYGKTFLLNRWCEELNHTGYPAIYFDAWQNDFTPEPLVAFIAELDTALKPLFKEVPIAQKIMQSAFEKMSVLWKPMAIAVAKHGLKMATGVAVDKLVPLADTDSYDDGGSGDNAEENPATIQTLKGDLAKAYEQTLQQHTSKKAAIKAFRNSLDMLIKVLEKDGAFQLPIFLFVDELDRCRPDYAIELLEGIKHLFGELKGSASHCLSIGEKSMLTLLISAFDMT
jgi:predicted KAP-like P-loop ATPase